MGPRPKIPAWSISKGVWKPLIAKTGMSGRAFSRRTADLRRLDQRPPRGDLGAVGQRDRHQVIEHAGRVDQGDLDVVVLQRLDHRAGVEPQDLRELGALHPPLLPRRDGLLLRGRRACCGPGRPRTLGPGRGSGWRSDRPGRAPLDRVERAGIDSPVLVHHEVGVGGPHQGVVLGGLDVPVLGVQDLPGHQGLVDGIGRGDDPQIVPHRPAPA